MRYARRAMGAVVAGLALVLTATPAEAQQQSGVVNVLVAPLSTAAGIDREFGEDVAERVRDRISDMSGMQVIDPDEVEEALERFDLQAANLGMIEWRQLAGRLNAQMLMWGEATPGGEGVTINVSIIDPSTGDELEVPEFTASQDADQVANRITQGLEEVVAYQRSVVFCSEYLGSNQYEDALNNCSRALEVNPNSMRALYLRGRVYQEQENYEAALEDLERVVEAAPSNTDALQSAAYVNTQLGNTRRAQELYQEYLNFRPDDADVRLNIAYNLAQSGAYQEAMEILQEGVQRDSTNAALWEYLGNVALAKGTSGAGTAPGGSEGAAGDTTAAAGDTTAAAAAAAGGVQDSAAVQVAIRAYDKVLELKGDSINPSILTNVIAANLAMGEEEEALQFSERALETIERGGGTMAAASDTASEMAAGTDTAGAAADTTGTAADTTGGESEVPGRTEQTREQLLASIHSLRADIFGRQEQFRRAVEEMNRVLELQPDFQRAYMKRGFFKLRAGNTDSAIEDFRTAVQEQDANPDQVAQAIFGRGYQNYFQRGQYGTAIDMFETALEFAQDPNLVSQTNFFIAYGHYQMGTAIDTQNQQAEACQPARNALSQFQQVTPYLNRAGNYQPNSQSQIRDAVDTQIYRQNQIIESACSD